jgi:hypothetical protein
LTDGLGNFFRVACARKIKEQSGLHFQILFFAFLEESGWLAAIMVGMRATASQKF